MKPAALHWRRSCLPQSRRATSTPARRRFGPFALAAALVPLVPAGAAPAMAATGPNLAVDVAADRHAINPDIYGLNFAFGKRAFGDTDPQLAADQAFAAEIHVPLDRWGGDSTSRYNWQTGVTNEAVNFFFENIPTDVDHNAFVAQDRARGARTLLTVNTMGSVARPGSPLDRPYACGFKIAKYGPQQSVDTFDAPPTCGNGRHPDGSPITGNDPADTSVTVAPSFIGSLVSDLVGRDGTAAVGGVRDYALDNEPDLWFDTHPDVHPAHLGYDELFTKDRDVAAAIKTADPTARVVGPALSSYQGMFDVQYDMASPGADKIAHGGQDLAPWFLARMASQSTRLLDVFDNHYYPAEAGVALAPAGGTDTQALRLRSVRSLWDPSYVDESWIGAVYAGLGDKDRIRLIPRMHEMVDQSYPGTKLGIGEYNFGGVESMNGAVAQADVLGVFAREGLDQAEMWSPPHADQPGAYAFRMFRNYDGSGGGFGDTWVRSRNTSDPTNLSLAVYAAQRTGDGATTAMVVNKTDQPLTSPLALSGFAPGPAAQVWRYSQANLGAIVRQADQAVTPTGFSATYPANSITLVVMAPSGAAASAGGALRPLTPARILDTRFGTGGISGPVGPGASVDVQVTGRGGVPASGVSAVAMNVTVTQPSAAGWLTLSPNGVSRPLAANLNFTAGETIPNLVVVKLGAGGKVNLFNSAGNSHVIFDVAGWYSDTTAGNDGRYTAMVPARVLDTRNGTGGGVRLGPGASLDLTVSGHGGVPASGAEAAVMNVAVTNTTATSFMTIYPTGQARPLAANLNWNAGDTVSNRVMATLGTAGKVTIFNNAGGADVVVDVGGWYSDASVASTTGIYTPLVPARILDTRDATGGTGGPIAGGTSVDVQVAGRGGVPASGVSAVILNATVTQPAGPGFLTVSPTGATRPLVSDLNYSGGETRPNLVVVRLGAGGKVNLFTQTGTHIVFDVAGWFS